MSVHRRLLAAFDALPHNAQQRLLRTLPGHTQRRLADAATVLHRRYARMPPLDLRANKAAVTALLLELSRDAKRAIIKERSRREQLLAEAVDTVARWLGDIWIVACEFRTNFALAHACLLFACDALEQIANGCGGHVSPSLPCPRSHRPQLQVRLQQHPRPHPDQTLHRHPRQVLHAQRRTQPRDRRPVDMA